MGFIGQDKVFARDLAYAADAIVVVQRGANDVENGTNLKAAYVKATGLTPGGNALAADNRAVVQVSAGNYDFGSTAFDMDTDFVDVIGEGVCRCDRDPAISWDGTPYASSVAAIDLSSAIFHWPSSHLICDTDTEVVNVTCRDVLLQGFLIEQESSSVDGLKIDEANGCDNGRFIDLGFVLPAVTDEAILDGTNTEIASYFENCHSQAQMLADCATLSGTCKTCTGGTSSFAASNVASGTFANCVVGGNGSGFGSTSSGTFTDCIGADSCFGYAGAASGTFMRCLSGDNSFGYNASALGTFIECIASSCSFDACSSCGSGSSAVMRRCISVGRNDGVLAWEGLMEDCVIETTCDAGCSGGGAVSLHQCSACGRIYGGTFLSINCAAIRSGSTAYCAAVAHIRTNEAEVNGFTNKIGTPYSVVDADITI